MSKTGYKTMHDKTEDYANLLSLNYSEAPVKKIGGEWHEAKTFHIGGPESREVEDALEKVKNFIQREFSGGENVHLVKLSIARAVGEESYEFQKDDGIILRLIYPGRSFRASIQEIGSTEDLKSEIRNHHKRLSEKMKESGGVLSQAGYNIGQEVTLQRQFEEMNLSSDGDFDAFFFFEPRENSENIEMKSRMFVRDSGSIHEVVQ